MGAITKVKQNQDDVRAEKFGRCQGVKSKLKKLQRVKISILRMLEGSNYQ